MGSDDAGAPSGDADGPGALAFVHDRGALARRFLLAELLAPPLALRRRSRHAGPGSPPGPSREQPAAPAGGERR
jgi:hypothetical protein